MVAFAKRIPGFEELSQSDQLNLIKGTFIEVWVVRLAPLIDVESNTLTLQDGTTLTREMLNVMMIDEEIVQHIFSLGDRCSRCGNVLMSHYVGLFVGPFVVRCRSLTTDHASHWMKWLFLCGANRRQLCPCFSRIKNFNLDDHGTALFIAVNLSARDRDGVRQRETVDSIQNKLSEALTIHLKR